jgi:O-antigen/teichoic acid export membrane protein
MLTFLAAQSDRLVFGKMIPMDLFGVYGIAVMLAALPTQAVQKLGGSVIFPAYARLAARGDLHQVFTRVRLPLLIGGAAMVSGLIACGPHLIRFLYDSRYHQAGWILQYLAAVAWFQVLECTIGAALLATGRVRWVAAGSGAKVVGMVALVPLGFHLGGFPGALAGLVLAEALKYLTAAVGLASSGLQGFPADIGLSVLVAGISAVGFLAGGTVQAGRYTNLVALLVSGLLAAGTWTALGLVYLRRERSAGGLPWGKPAGLPD